MSSFWRLSNRKIRNLKRKKVTYRRKKWSDKKIDREKRKGNIIIRRKDVGRPKRHYINMYYYTPPRPNMLVKTTYHLGKKS